jgi:PAS domain S-box-containing protein
MQQQASHQRHFARLLLVLGCVSGVAFWITASGVNAWLFGAGSFSAQLLSPEPMAIYTRLFTGMLLFAFGLCGSLVMRQRACTDTALRESEARFRHLIEGSVQGILIHRDDHALFVNQAYADIFGYETPEAIYRLDTLLLLIAPHEHARLCRYQDDRLAGKEVPTHYEYQGVRKDGARVWLDMQVRVITWQGVPAVQSTVFDISKRKRAEEERKRLEDQLHQVQKMEALGTLSGGIAHEFNNILAAIIGFTEMATYDLPPTHPTHRHLQAVLSAGKRAKDLVQQILAFSRPSHQDRRPVQVALVIQEVLSLLRATLPTTIDIRQHFTGQQSLVLAHQGQLHQVVMNLCANAEYAMREAGGTLEIGLDVVDIAYDCTTPHSTLAPGSYVRLTIRDSGQGMTPEIIEHIFEPFFTTKSVGEGTGMGLAIVHGIVTGHGGAITVESAPGHGVTFAVYLPRIANAAATEINAPAEDIRRGKGRILFVDDEEMLARLGQGLLAHLGYDVVACTSSVDALATFRASPQCFDAVITDQTMPVMTGATLVEELRHIRPDIPIILCTGFSHLINAEKAQALGVDAFVMKPGVTQELVVTLQRVLAKRAAQQT